MSYVRHINTRDCKCYDCLEGNRLLQAQKTKVRARRQETTRMTASEQEQGRCRGSKIDFLSHSASEIIKAKALCEGCPVRTQCLLEALENFEHGCWGGTTWVEREQIRRKVRYLREKKIA
jgi:WhiB family transcriptional regulator, redox-sensing transcriptional regulator